MSVNVIKQEALKELPFDKGLPIFGHTFALLRDPIKWGKRMRAKHGKAFRTNILFQDAVLLSGPDAVELTWMDKDKCFSNELGYKRVFGHLTDTSVLMMDFEEHRKHRSALNPAFKASIMKDYLVTMDDVISDRITDWGVTGSFKFYPVAKQLTLDVATTVFLGLEQGTEHHRVNQALSDMLASSTGLVRLSIPGTKLYKGLKARAYIENMLRKQIPIRKKSQDTDVFTRLCQIKDEAGEGFSDDEIIGHLITFWIAGHDTLASSLTTLVYQLGKHPEWQKKLHDEISSLNLLGKQSTLEDLKSLTLCDYAFKEALRLVPPAISTPRATLRDVAFMGYRIPKGIQVSTSLYDLHNNPEYWPEPETFNPMRFAPENTPKDRHRFAWAPFGGGAHKCIGMIFAQIQAKVFLINLLEKYEIILPENYEIKMQILPTARPTDGLPITLKLRVA